MHYSKKPHQRGFTLIELMVVVAIVAILAAIGIPSYQQYVIRSYRAEARNMLLATAQRLEQNYTVAGSYNLNPAGAAINDAMLATWGFSQVMTGGSVRYNISFQVIPVQQPTVTTFVLLATPVTNNDLVCGILSLDNVNLKGANGQNNRSIVTRDCWDR